MTYSTVIGNLIRAIFINQATRAPDFLKDDLPSGASAVNKFVQGVGRRVCDKYARQPDLDQIVFSPAYGWLCDPYLNNTGQGPTTQGKTYPVSSKDGGQCSGKLYASSITYRTSVDYGKPTFHWNPPRTVTKGCGELPLYYGPCYLQVSTNPNGNNYFVWKSTLNSSEGTNAGVFSNQEIAQLLDCWVQLCPGQGKESDDCGVPDGYNPPDYPTLPDLPPPTVPPPGSTNPDWDVNLNPDGSINFCISNSCTNIGTPTPNAPRRDANEDPGTSDGLPVGTDPNTREASGCIASDRVLTGIQISFIQVPTSETTLSGKFYRSPAWIAFGPSLGQLDFVNDGAWLADSQFVIPNSEYCTCWYVKVRKGFRANIQAFSRVKESYRETKK